MPFVKYIVLADDDPDDVQLFGEALVNACPDVNLRVASDGFKLLSLIVEAPKPEVIVLDLNMPRKSGKECLEEIRANVDFRDVAVVILSTSSHPTEINDCLKKGANQYFVKPGSLEEIKKIAQSICSGSYRYRA